MTTGKKLFVLNERIIRCRKCPRLVRYRERVAREKRRAYRDWDYWGQPVPGFGDPQAELLVLGLAPAAHGGNRTGRVFTGDRSGDFLYRGLFEAGFANQPISVSWDDGLKLRACYITASVRCCPPANKPTPDEQAHCRPYLEEEFSLLPNVRAVLALGRLAHDTFLKLLREQGKIDRVGAFPFRHGACYDLPAPSWPPTGTSSGAKAQAKEELRISRVETRPRPSKPEEQTVRLFDSFHPSQQNTQTGRLTRAMFARVLRQIRTYLQS